MDDNKVVGVVIPPCWVDGKIFRFVKLTDGSAEVQVWKRKPRAWTASDVPLDHLLFADSLTTKELADNRVS